MSVRRLYLH